MNWLQSIIYALISGMAEFLPVSSSAHQSVLLTLFGQSEIPTALNFTVHLGALAAVYINCQNHLSALKRTQFLLSIPKQRRKRQPDSTLVSELRIFRTASIISVIIVLLATFILQANIKLNWLSVLLLINGLLLYLTGRISTGNKSSISMNRFDAALLGFTSGIGALPGLSRLGVGASAMVYRGASAKNVLNWCLLVSIPFLCALCICDVILMFMLGVVGFGFVAFLQCLLAAVFSYIGATLSITLLRFLAVKVGFSWFSYYCWGLALFAFLLYMI